MAAVFLFYQACRHSLSLLCQIYCMIVVSLSLLSTECLPVAFQGPLCLPAGCFQTLFSHISFPDARRARVVSVYQIAQIMLVMSSCLSQTSHSTAKQAVHLKALKLCVCAEQLSHTDTEKLVTETSFACWPRWKVICKSDSHRFGVFTNI